MSCRVWLQTIPKHLPGSFQVILKTWLVQLCLIKTGAKLWRIVALQKQDWTLLLYMNSYLKDFSSKRGTEMGHKDTTERESNKCWKRNLQWLEWQSLCIGSVWWVGTDRIEPSWPASRSWWSRKNDRKRDIEINLDFDNVLNLQKVNLLHFFWRIAYSLVCHGCSRNIKELSEGPLFLLLSAHGSCPKEEQIRKF